ncbi:protein enabled homolog [Penaeus vannamei]|uniref:protein enabled homolog n=1 Tax=Penaeus vannamei TaxID=6689 RepID=UPI00387FB1D5
MRGGHWQPRRRRRLGGDSASHGREPPPAQHPCEPPVRARPLLPPRGAPRSRSPRRRALTRPRRPLQVRPPSSGGRPSRDSVLSPECLSRRRRRQPQVLADVVAVAVVQRRSLASPGRTHDAPRRRPQPALRTAHIPPTAEDPHTSSACNRLIPAPFATFVPPPPPPPSGPSLCPFRTRRRPTPPPEGASRRQTQLPGALPEDPPPIGLA